MLQNPFADSAIVSGYEAWYQTTGRRAERLEMAFVGRLLAGFLGASTTVLDAGCGTGHFNRWFSEWGLQSVISSAVGVLVAVVVVLSKR